MAQGHGEEKPTLDSEHDDCTHWIGKMKQNETKREDRQQTDGYTGLHKPAKQGER